MCVYTHAYISIYTGIREQVGCNSGFQCRVSMGLIGIGGGGVAVKEKRKCKDIEVEHAM